MLATRTPKNAFFFGKFYRGHDPPHPRRSLYTPPVETPAPSTPGQTAYHRQQGRPCQMQGRPCTPGRFTRCTGLCPIPDSPRRADRTGGGVLEGGQCVRQTTLFRMQNIFHANMYKRCLCNLTFPWIRV